MPPVKFEPTISADERPRTYVSDRAVTGTGVRRLDEGNFLKRPELSARKRERERERELRDNRNVNGHHTMGTREVFHTVIYK